MNKKKINRFLNYNGMKISLHRIFQLIINLKIFIKKK